MTRRMLVVAAAALALCAPAAHAAEHTGTLNGSNWFAVVPDSGWNGTFVVIAHGYRDPGEHPNEIADTTPGYEGTARSLAAEGYAVATTSYRKNGWAVKEALVDLVDVADHVKATVLPAPPVRSLLAGFSMGGLTTLERAKRGGFDGYLAMCAPGGGTGRQFDWLAVTLLAHDVVFGLPASWGTVADGDDDIDGATGGVGSTVGSWLAAPGNYARMEFARLVAGVPFSPDYYTTGIFTNFTTATEVRGELERRAGGPVVQNLDHAYSLRDDQKDFLVSQGLSEAQIDDWLAEMNATRYSAPPSSRAYVDHYAAPTGKLKRPVLTMHTRVDTLIPVNHESKYAELVAAAGSSHLLRQWYTDADGHCEFTNAQIAAAADALDAWVATGLAPVAPPATVAGFLPGFVPAPWPQP